MVKYSPEIADKVCRLIATGSNLTQIESMPDMPYKQTVYEWMYKHPDFREKYETARIARLETKEEELRARIESTPEEACALKKLDILISFDKWFMSKINPRKYGEKTTIAGDRDNPLTLNLAAVLDERIAARSKPRALPPQQDDSSSRLALPVIDAEHSES